MLKLSRLYIDNAHRIDYPIPAAVQTLIKAGTITIEDGSVWMLKDESGVTEWTPMETTAGRKGYVTISVFRRDNILGEGGNDNISDSMRLICLLGPWRLETDQYDSDETYTVGSFVKGITNTDVTKRGGIFAPWDSETDLASEIIAEVFQAPNADAGIFLGFMAKG
jgi:hypothetical protein